MKEMSRKAGIMGVIIGDALGCPVQFRSRAERVKDPVTGMRGYGTYNMPAGTWTDDGSMTIATMASIKSKGKVDLTDIMDRFCDWLQHGAYTQGGKAFDIGNGTMDAILRYLKGRDAYNCGGRGERDNGNGSLMRILPVCLYCYDAGLDDEKAVTVIHAVSALTHAHLRSKIACGLYYFMVKGILDNRDVEDLIHTLQDGLDRGFAFYKQDLSCTAELAYYGRLTDLFAFAKRPVNDIRSSGYVVDTLEAAVWSLLQTSDFASALLTSVNLGDDTDTVGAICGGLAGLYYGYGAIPKDWLDVIDQKDKVMELCSQGMAKNEGRKPGRARNVDIFRDTMKQCQDNKALRAAVEKSVSERRLYLEADSIPENEVNDCRKDADHARVIVSGKRSFEAAGAYPGKKVCVLNFASATNPGGGVKNGASAQEECLCRCSTLYPVLDTPEMMTRFYRPHYRYASPLYNDDIIYVPDVVVFKTDEAEPQTMPEHDWYKADVLTCAAPNLREIRIDWSDPAFEGEKKGLKALIEKRIRRIFDVAVHEGAQVLVLGAFGCGAFANPPQLVAGVFKKVTEEYKRYFEVIEYAVYCAGEKTENYKAFSKAFGCEI